MQPAASWASALQIWKLKPDERTLQQGFQNSAELQSGMPVFFGQGRIRGATDADCRQPSSKGLAIMNATLQPVLVCGQSDNTDLSVFVSDAGVEKTEDRATGACQLRRPFVPDMISHAMDSKCGRGLQAATASRIVVSGVGSRPGTPPTFSLPSVCRHTNDLRS